MVYFIKITDDNQAYNLAAFTGSFLYAQCMRKDDDKLPEDSALLKVFTEVFSQVYNKLHIDVQNKLTDEILYVHDTFFNNKELLENARKAFKELVLKHK